MHFLLLRLAKCDSNDTGTWGVRTRAITVDSAGKLEWIERLILELKGPIGDSHGLFTDHHHLVHAWSVNSLLNATKPINTTALCVVCVWKHTKCFPLPVTSIHRL